MIFNPPARKKGALINDGRANKNPASKGLTASGDPVQSVRMPAGD
jgi:hypothetical protein